MSMQTYIVTYDLAESGQRYNKLIELIKSEYAWAKIGYSAFIVKSSLSHTELRDKFKQALDSNDKLFVGAISAPAAWYGLSDEVSKWLNNNL